MPRKAMLPQTRRHIFVYDEDWDWIVENYGPGSETGLGISGAIRAIIHAKVAYEKAKFERLAEELRRRSQQQAALAEHEEVL